MAIPIDACGGEIAHPLQGQLLQLLSQARQHGIRSLFAGWDGADQMGDGGERVVAWHDSVGAIKGQIIAAGFWAAARADHFRSKRFGQLGQMAPAESSAEDAQPGIRREWNTTVDKSVQHQYKRINCSFVVADSSFSLVPSRDSMLPQSRLSRRDRAQAQDTPRLRTASALLAAALVTGAFLLAPDRPEQSASICEHYHSEAACRVW